jgi:enhancing lycopene biosynthesis protein 2
MSTGMQNRVGVILSGCGYLDGAEIHEAVLALYFLDRAGAKIECFAPDRDQMHVVNHLTGDETSETRNVLIESARIARGEIRDVSQADMSELDALVMPGGFGAAKNLSNFAIKGPDAEIDPDVVRLVGQAVEAGKPIVAICISPAVLAAALAKNGYSAKLTIGSDEGTAAAIEKLGSNHQQCPVDGCVVDEDRRILTTPAYMLGPGPKDVGAGIEQAIEKLMGWLA